MANTTNFGWETPDDTDLVKDGAAAIRTLGSAIDTSLVDLKGGTTGQLLSKASNTDMDFTWAAAPSAGGFTEIATGSLTGTTVTVSSIPTTYKTLVVRVYQMRPVNDGAYLKIHFNGDTTNKYSYTTATTATNVSGPVAFWNVTTNGSDNGTSSGFVETIIPNYASSATFKIGQSFAVVNNETTPANVDYNRSQAVYLSTTAITSLTFSLNSGDFTSGTYFVYGVN